MSKRDGTVGPKMQYSPEELEHFAEFRRRFPITLEHSLITYRKGQEPKTTGRFKDPFLNQLAQRMKEMAAEKKVK